jgi:hypothetical protein
MAKIIGIMGESGSGKTTSLKNLDPKTTIYMDCDKKGLAWKGWRNQYNAQNKNYFADDHANVAKLLLQKVNTDKAYKDIKVVVIDTLNGIMVADEMRRAKEKNFDKWLDLATAVYDIVDYALTMRDDVTVIFTAHSQTDHDENGYTFTRIKTSGRKLDKIVLESKFPVVLHAKVLDGKHVFETQADFSTAKTPLGAFDEKYIDNDIIPVLKALEDF